MAVDVAYDGEDATTKLAVNAYDVVVLDRDLPGVHGDTICRRIAQENLPVMVLMLTAARRASRSGDWPRRPWRRRLSREAVPTSPSSCCGSSALARRKPGAQARVLRFAGIELDPLHVVRLRG